MTAATGFRKGQTPSLECTSKDRINTKLPLQNAGNILLPHKCSKPECAELPAFERLSRAMHDFDLDLALRQHQALSPADEATRRQFLALLAADARCFWRDCFPAHFTASAWLVSADGERALLLHHRKLGRWLQPGGHADGDSDLARVALREAAEETGLVGLSVDADVFDLDAHVIPARGDEPEHWHYDLRFAVRATASERFIANSESRDMTWRSISDIGADLALDDSIRRMARRWLDRRC